MVRNFYHRVFIIIVVSIITVFAGVLFVHQPGANHALRACLHGGGGPQVGEVTRLGGVTRLSI